MFSIVFGAISRFFTTTAAVTTINNKSNTEAVATLTTNKWRNNEAVCTIHFCATVRMPQQWNCTDHDISQARLYSVMVTTALIMTTTALIVVTAALTMMTTALIMVTAALMMVAL